MKRTKKMDSRPSSTEPIVHPTIIITKLEDIPKVKSPKTREPVTESKTNNPF